MSRVNYTQLAADPFKKFYEFSNTLKHPSYGETIRGLVDIRVSQINGCAFCLDMHSKEAKIRGERELRLYHVAIWRESPLFDAREKAALAWAETLTEVADGGVPDAAYEAARAHFSEQELSELTFAVVAINGWNRLSIAFANTPGSQDKLFGLDKAGLN
ncbi:MAG: carboxymuconolactone decarboxylase family protein [Rhodospirillaceae bacterium]|nr:carboxymuconolactone decarboxylase family protein [Rhodospirillaceae bacterium]